MLRNNYGVQRVCKYYTVVSKHSRVTQQSQCEEQTEGTQVPVMSRRLFLLYCVDKPGMAEESVNEEVGIGMMNLPVKPFLQSLALGRTTAAHTPLPFLLSTSKPELLADRFRWECTLDILLVAEDKERDPSELLFREHSKEFGPRRV